MQLSGAQNEHGLQEVAYHREIKLKCAESLNQDSKIARF